MTASSALRPIERRILFLEESGVDRSEIAQRFRRSPEFIGRLIDLARLPRRQPWHDASRLRPLERRVLAWRAQGADYAEVGQRFQRSPDFVQRVEELAHFKLRARS